MDNYQSIQMRCSEDEITLTRFVEKDRIYDFLAGLNLDFDAVRVQILGNEELPTLNEAIAIVRVEEGRRGVMIEVGQVESLTLVAKDVNEGKTSLEFQTIKNKSSEVVNKDLLWCTYCKKPRHTRERCWKLHGKPQTKSNKFSEREGSSRRAYTTKQDPQEQNAKFNKEEIEKLKNLLGFLENNILTGTRDEEDDWTC